MALLALLVAAGLGAADAAHAGDEPVLAIVPLGDPDPALVQFLADSLARRFRVRPRIEPGVAMPDAAWYAPRKRWRAERILDVLDALQVGDGVRVTAITEEPISTTKGEVYDWGIAGLGSIGGKSCVLSSYYFRRFRKSRGTYHRYMENLVVHEFGHTLGLDHCPLDRCVMADAKGNAIRAARISTNELCPRCAALAAGQLRFRREPVTWTAEELATLERLDAH